MIFAKGKLHLSDFKQFFFIPIALGGQILCYAQPRDGVFLEATFTCYDQYWKFCFIGIVIIYSQFSSRRKRLDLIEFF